MYRIVSKKVLNPTVIMMDIEAPLVARKAQAGQFIILRTDSEGERILSAIPKDSFKIALCVEGKQYDSPELAALVGRACDEMGKISLVIGSSHGLSESVKKEANLRLSLSKLTFPHQLMRPLLMEVLYRSFTIIAGKKYHK